MKTLCRRWIAWCAVGFLAVTLSASAADIPPLPADRNFVQDYADVITPEVEARVGAFQKECFEQFNTPIVVVTIRSMGEYGGQGDSIERFALAWFNRWGIGKAGPDGRLYNQGVLVLVSVGDRKARIELGADWGRRWDRHCEQIMSGLMVPEFKAGRYPEGILQGVAALADMAKVGPAATPPESSIIERIQKEVRRASTTHPRYSPLRTDIVLLVTAIGAVLVVVAFFRPPAERKAWLAAGVGLIIGVWFLWFVLVIVYGLFRGRLRGGRGGGGGGFSSGGGFGGGFGGGGGASGGW